MVDRRMAGAVAVTGGSVVMLVGSFLPWLRSGARNRSSYTIFDLVERLGFAPDGVVAWSLRLWPLVPLLLIAVVVAGWAVITQHLQWRFALMIGVAAIVWIGGTATALVLAPDVALFRIGAGPTVSLVGAVLTLGGLAALKPPRSVQRSAHPGCAER